MSGFIPYTPQGPDEIHTPDKLKVLGNVKTAFEANWKLWESDGEKQRRNGDDMMDCVSFSAANVIENILNYYRYIFFKGIANDEQTTIFKIASDLGLYDNGKANVSDRYIAKISNTTRNGNDQKTVWDAIRHYGVVSENDWPFVETWDEYYQEVPDWLIGYGKHFADQIDINYEFVESINYIDALAYSPLQTCLYAWNGQNQTGDYVRVDIPFDHATVVDGYESLLRWNIFDSYEPFNKSCTWDFNFGWGVLPTLHLKKKSFWTRVLEYLKEIMK